MFFRYAWSILFNMLVLGYRGQLSEAMTVTSMTNTLSHPIVCVLIINNAFMGITVSIFLKYLNSILKAYATGCEVVATALISWSVTAPHLTCHAMCRLSLNALALLHLLHHMPSYVNALALIHLIHSHSFLPSRNPFYDPQYARVRASRHPTNGPWFSPPN